MNRKKFIVDNVEKLNMNQKNELIKIIEINDLNYMKNNNGLFISLNNVDNNIIDHIYEHIVYCLEQKTETATTDNFQIENLRCLQHYLNNPNNNPDNMQNNLQVTPPPEPIIEGKIKKDIIPKKDIKVTTINISDMQKDIINFSKNI